MSGSVPTLTGRQTDFGITGRETGVRYEGLAVIGSGGMATVQYGRLHGPHGFVRSVAIKRLHPQFAQDPEFVKMFLDEARLTARLAHANIVATLDVIDGPGELGLVMEYVHGESLWGLLKLSNQYGQQIPVRIAAALAAGVLQGLHAAHEARDDLGRPINLVHRDVSPHNILVGSDGMARLIDFGVAKAVGRLRTTPSGEIKGKLIYMAPEQLSGAEIDRRADIYGAAAVLWEALTGVALFDGPSESAIVHAVLLNAIDHPREHRPDVPSALDAIVMRGLSRDPAQRYATAREMALELERNVGIASQSELADWLQELAGARLAERSRLIASLQEPAANALASAAGGNTRSLAQPNTKPMPVAASGSVFRRRQQQSALGARRLGLAVLALIVIGVGFWSVRVWQRAAMAGAPPASPAPREHVAPEPATIIQAATAQPTARLPSPAQQPSAAEIEADLPGAVAPSAPEGPPAVPLLATKVEPAPLPAHAKKRERAAPPSQPTAAPVPRADCTPWFYVDEAGIRRPKPGCL